MPAPDLTSADTHVNLVQRIQVLEQERDQLQTELRHANRAVDACVADLMRARQQLGDTSLALQLSQEQESRLMREQAILQERTRLARELHDSVTQSLYSLVLYSRALARLLPADIPTDAQDYAARLERLAQDTLREMRLLIFELRPAALAEEGLVAALRSRLESVEARASVEAFLEAPAEVNLPPAIEEALYRIAQEALNNALKHARATTVRVTLSVGGDSAYLAVRDNGAGFDPTAEHIAGLGLTNMRERAADLDGALRIESLPDQGTLVWVRLPLPADPQEAP
ncbi:MAG: sensor histidine kinase [Chloroflexi bacterium]|nr:sensor histidine kinase [Chloroflexota bacterium]MBU1746089.1 sensor histidine kinase [Chloroflexota bacterium]